VRSFFSGCALELFLILEPLFAIERKTCKSDIMRGVGSVKKIAHCRSAVFFITLLGIGARELIRAAGLASPPRNAASREKESRRDKLEVCVTPRVQRTVIYGRAQPNSKKNVQRAKMSIGSVQKSAALAHTHSRMHHNKGAASPR
jgi:hypothetical protein